MSESSPPPLIHTRGLIKRFGEKVAVAGLDLTVPAGEFFCFLGPNGAGKTTTIKMLTGLVRPTEGVAEIGGFDIQNVRIFLPPLVTCKEDERVQLDACPSGKLRRSMTPIHVGTQIMQVSL